MIVRQSIVSSWPASTLFFIAGPSDDSTPITRIFGLWLFTAIDTPEMRPPPPIGTTTASTSGQSCTISRPNVPCPAISCSSSNGCTYVSPSVANELLRLLVRLVPDVAVQHDFGAVALRGGDLGRRRVRGHADDRANAVDLRRERDALRVIAGRRADDAASLLLLGHLRELVQRAANLVRPDALEHLGLEPNVVAGRSLSCRDVSSGVCLMCSAMRARGVLEVGERQDEWSGGSLRHGLVRLTLRLGFRGVDGREELAHDRFVSSGLSHSHDVRGARNDGVLRTGRHLRVASSRSADRLRRTRRP